jgi:hypothetical protein
MRLAKGSNAVVGELETGNEVSNRDSKGKDHAGVVLDDSVIRKREESAEIEVEK